MTKYTISFVAPVYRTMEIEAENPDDAEKKGWDQLASELEKYSEEYVWCDYGDPELDELVEKTPVKRRKKVRNL